MVWCSGSNLQIFMPKLQGHLLSTEIRLLVNENLGVLGFRDNAEIPLSLHMIRVLPKGNLWFLWLKWALFSKRIPMY